MNRELKKFIVPIFVSHLSGIPLVLLPTLAMATAINLAQAAPLHPLRVRSAFAQVETKNLVFDGCPYVPVSSVDVLDFGEIPIDAKSKQGEPLEF